MGEPDGGTPNTPPAGGDDGDKGGGTHTQEQVNKLVGTARVEARQAFLKKHGFESEEALEASLKEAADLKKSQMTELEQAQKERDEAIAAAAAAKAEADAANLNVLRARVGREKGLPEPFIARLQGTDEESLTTEVDELLPFVKGAPDSEDDDLGGGSGPAGGDSGGGKTPDEKMAGVLFKQLTHRP